MDWRSNLTKKQKAHLRDMGVNSKDAFVATRNSQLESMAQEGSTGEACWTCREIAERLGVCQTK